MYVMEVPFINLDQIYASGQVFRWIRYRDGKYVIPHRNKALKIEQQKDRLIMSCNEEDFYNVWWEYFDLQTDYFWLNHQAKAQGGQIKISAVRGSGIHILKQDLFEMIVTFMLATATNIPNVKRMLHLIETACGTIHKQTMRECGQVTWYEFPTPKQLLRGAKRLEDSFGLKRKENVLQLCQDICDGWLDLDVLRQVDYSYAKEWLMEFDGIGSKVADCICLYGLHHMEAFPVDTHIAQILQRDFDCDVETFLEWYGVDELNGLLQQYLYYNEINPPKEETRVWA